MQSLEKCLNWVLSPAHFSIKSEDFFLDRFLCLLLDYLQETSSVQAFLPWPVSAVWNCLRQVLQKYPYPPASANVKNCAFRTKAVISWNINKKILGADWARCVNRVGTPVPTLVLRIIWRTPARKQLLLQLILMRGTSIAQPLVQIIQRPGLQVRQACDVAHACNRGRPLCRPLQQKNRLDTMQHHGCYCFFKASRDIFAICWGIDYIFCNDQREGHTRNWTRMKLWSISSRRNTQAELGWRLPKISRTEPVSTDSPQKVFAWKLGIPSPSAIRVSTSAAEFITGSSKEL